MRAPAEKERQATRADLLALPEDARVEIISGVLVQKEAATPLHSNAQSNIDTQVSWRFKRRGGDDDRPGGWVILTEAEIEHETHELYRHDLAGWRRERMPAIPRERPILTRPDWVCEILSPSNASNDRVRKLRTLHRCGVPHYWLVAVEEGILTVHEWAEPGYVLVATGERGERLRLPPFGAVELEVGVLLGDDPSD